MPGTIDDFMSRFGGEKTIDDREAAEYHDRFDSTHPDDRAFDNQTYHESATEYLGKLPEDQFQSGAVLRENAEVDAVRLDHSAEGIGLAG